MGIRYFYMFTNYYFKFFLNNVIAKYSFENVFFSKVNICQIENKNIIINPINFSINFTIIMYIVSMMSIIMRSSTTHGLLVCYVPLSELQKRLTRKALPFGERLY
jgi:hypothetical protein